MNTIAIIYYLAVIGLGGLSPIPMISKEACVSAANRLAAATDAGSPRCIGTDGNIYEARSGKWRS